MKYTLLELVQLIASSMDSDEVNSITDSVEAQQIANVIQTTYFDIIGRANLPEHYDLVNLEGSGSAITPTLMFVPPTINEIRWIKYNELFQSVDVASHGVNLDIVPSTVGGIATFSLVSGTGYANGTYTGVPLIGGHGSAATVNITVSGGIPGSVTLNNTGLNYQVGDVLTVTGIGAGTGFLLTVRTLVPTSAFIRPKWIEYLDLETFLDFMHAMSPDDPSVFTYQLTANNSVFTVTYRNDMAPTYYTTMDDNSVLFDTFDSSLETAMQASNSLCYGRLSIPFLQTDTFIPNLEDDQFPLLLNEAKALAFAELKQTQHATAERNSKRGWTHVQTKKNAVFPPMQSFQQLPYYGRK